MNTSYLKSLVQISSITFRWKDFCFDQSEIDYIEGLRAKAFEILSDNNLGEENKLSQIKEIIEENKSRINDLVKKSIIGDSTVKAHSKGQYKIISKYGILDHEGKDEDMKILKFLAIIHDIGELAVGDTILEKKKINGEDKEKDEAKKLIKKLFGLKSKEAIEIYNINSIENSPIHKEFKLYEILSYLNGALLAYKNRNNIKNAADIVKKVFEIHLAKIICEISRGRKSFAKYIYDNLGIINEAANYIGYDITGIFIALSENSRIDDMEEDAKMIIKLLKENKSLLLNIFGKIDWSETPYQIFEEFMSNIQGINNDKIMVFGLTDIFIISILIYNNILSKSQGKGILLGNMKYGGKGKRYIYIQIRRVMGMIEEGKTQEEKQMIINELKETYIGNKDDNNPSCPFYKSDNKNDFLENALNYFLEDIIPNIEKNHI